MLKGKSKQGICYCVCSSWHLFHCEAKLENISCHLALPNAFSRILIQFFSSKQETICIKKQTYVFNLIKYYFLCFTKRYLVYQLYYSVTQWFNKAILWSLVQQAKIKHLLSKKRKVVYIVLKYLYI